MKHNPRPGWDYDSRSTQNEKLSRARPQDREIPPKVGGPVLEPFSGKYLQISRVFWGPLWSFRQNAKSPRVAIAHLGSAGRPGKNAFHFVSRKRQEARREMKRILKRMHLSHERTKG
jgi:hypothetical protein